MRDQGDMVPTSTGMSLWQGSQKGSSPLSRIDPVELDRHRQHKTGMDQHDISIDRQLA